jgi:rhamnosyltransferase
MISTVSIIVPARNARGFAEQQIAALSQQSLQADRKLVIDSESSDASTSLYRAAGFEVVRIAARDFDHGGTRNFALRRCDTDILVYLTQDAIPVAADAIERLCAPLTTNSAVGLVYGRQLPRTNAGAIERHARLFSYPSTSQVITADRIDALGIRASYNSNSFAAYRRSALEQIGGFPEKIIMGEDQVAAASLLLANWSIVYAGDAVVDHSHGYSLMEEFRRYFDNGVYRRQYKVAFARFEAASGAQREGRRFVGSEMHYLLRHAPLRLPEAAIRTAVKLVAYRLGHHEALLPRGLKRRLAMNQSYFGPVYGS